MTRDVTLDNLDDFGTMISIVNKGMELGNLASITFSAEDEENQIYYYKTFKNYEELVQKYTQEEYNKADNVRAVYLNQNVEYNLLVLYKKNNTIMLQTSDKEKEIKEENKKSRYEAYMDDDNCTYYEFSTGVFAKYDPNLELYFSLDANNAWVFNNNVLPWIIGAEYDFVEIKKNSNTGKKI